MNILDAATMRAIIDSGDLIEFGPSGEVKAGRPRLTIQRIGGAYIVQSGDGRQSYSCPTWEEAEAAALKVVDAGLAE